MLEAIINYSQVPIEYIFSADQAGAYKPSPKIYALPEKKLGLAKQEILHVAGSLYDMLGTRAYGLDCYWSNRAGEYTFNPRYTLEYERKDLYELLEIL